MLWPLQMMTRFVDVGNVVRSVVGWGKGGVQGKRMLIIAGEKDVLMGVDLMRKMAAEYRKAAMKGWVALVGETETTARAIPGDEDGVGFTQCSIQGQPCIIIGCMLFPMLLAALAPGAVTPQAPSNVLQTLKGPPGSAV